VLGYRAGEIGEPKIARLLAAKGGVEVVAPHATEKVEEWARGRKIQWLKREFDDSDLEGCFLVIVATSSHGKR
jgi:siroheme synthase-like protein